IGSPEKTGDRDTYQLYAETDRQPRARLYFDQQTGLLVRLIRYSESPLGLIPTRIDYTDYKIVDRVQVPDRWTIARPAGQFAVRLIETQQNVTIEDAKFARPADNSGPPFGESR